MSQKKKKNHDLENSLETIFLGLILYYRDYFAFT